METSTFWTVIIIQSIVFLGGLIKIHHESYSKQKGKNLATKEDITSITEKIKTVEHQFLDKSATLKSNLDFKYNHKNEERLALIDFHKKFSKWIILLSEGIPRVYNAYNEEDIKNKDYSFFLVGQDYKEALALVRLYIKNDSLVKLILNFETLIYEKLYIIPRMCLINISKNNKFLEILKETEKDFEKWNPKFQELMEERKKIINDTAESTQLALKMIKSTKIEYEDCIKSYIDTICIELSSENP